MPKLNFNAIGILSLLASCCHKEGNYVGDDILQNSIKHQYGFPTNHDSIPKCEFCPLIHTTNEHFFNTPTN